jgi:hypothetical protein
MGGPLCVAVLNVVAVFLFLKVTLTFITSCVIKVKLKFEVALKNWTASRCEQQFTGILRHYRVDMLTAKNAH